MKKGLNAQRLIALGLAAVIGLSNIPSTAFASENLLDGAEQKESELQQENVEENESTDLTAPIEEESTEEVKEDSDQKEENTEEVDSTDESGEETDNTEDITSEETESTDPTEEETEDSENNEVTYTITFVDMDGKEISTQEVKEVSEIELPEAPEVEGFDFVKWDVDLDNLELTEDIVIKTIYEKIETEETEIEETETELEHKTLTTTIDNKEISIIGNMPANADLLVKKVIYTKNIEKSIEDALDGEVTITVYEAFDIKIKVGDEEYQPNEFDETVTVSIKNIDVEEKKEKELKVFHIDDSNAVEEISATIDSDKAEFEADSFSVYVVASVSYNTEDGTLLDNDYATAYLFDDGTLLVTEFKKESSIYTSYPWYSKKSDIKTLKFTDSITYIGKNAFRECTGFTGDLIIPDSVTAIGDQAFYNCKGFTGNLVIPNSVTTIGGSAFSGCSGFKGDLVIPDSVTTIGGGAFFKCSGFIGDLVIPNSVTTINASTFSGCSGFTGDLVIPNSVTTIGDYAFRECSGFTGDLIIPDSVTAIGEYAFTNCSGFDGTLTLSNTLTSIGTYAFANCTSLTGDLIIPNSVTTINFRAFCYCSGFDGILTLSNSLIKINSDTFYKCSGLTGDLIIPDSVETIDGEAFGECSGFDGTITLSNSLTTIGSEAFDNCSGLTGDLIIPDSVETIDHNAFLNCYNINNIQINSIFTYGVNVFYVEPEHKIATTSNWDEVRGTEEWEDLAKSWNRYGKTYKITFETNGGTKVEDQTINDGEKSTEPEQPTKENNRFIGWYKESTFKNEWDFSKDDVNENITLYAKWEEIPIATFKDGEKTVSTQISKYNSYEINTYKGYWIEEPESLTKSDYAFVGWSLTEGGEIVKFKEYKGSNFNNTSDITINGDNTVPIYQVTENITFYAVWTKNPVVTLMDGDSVIKTITTKYNRHTSTGYNGFWLEKPDDLSKDGYRFSHWSLTPNGSAVTFKDWPSSYFKDTSDITLNDNRTVDIYGKVTEDTTLYAVWDKIPLGIFKDGDIVLSTVASKYNEHSHPEYRNFWLEKPEDPKKEGYRFISWSCEDTDIKTYFAPYPSDAFIGSGIAMNGDRTVPIIKMPRDVVFDTVWEKIPVVTLMDGDTVITTVLTKYNEYNVSSNNAHYMGYWLEKPEAPEKEGHTFKGWKFANNNFVEEFPTYLEQYFKDTSEVEISNGRTVPSIPIESDTVLYAVYEPSKYEVSFDSNGGSTVPPQTINHGDKAKKPVDPTKKGYNLVGWFTEDDTEFDFDTPIKDNTKLIAKWEVKKYTVSFDSGTDDNIPDQEVEHGKTVDKPTEPKKEGAKFKGWFKEDDPDTPYDFDEPVEKEIKLVAKWEKEKYQVTFDSNGGSSVPSQTIEHGDKAKKPVDPTKEGYQLKCWLTEDGKEFDFDTPIKSALKLTAEWEIKKYKVSFDSGTDEEIPDQEIEHGDKIKKPVDPTKEGGEFKGWFKEDDPDTPYDFDEPVKKETKLVAKWDMKKYEVTFDSNGGSTVPSQTIEHGNKAKKPVDPKKEGNSLVGWFTEDNTEFNFDTPIKGDIKLIAKWEVAKYKITFDSNGGSNVPDQEVEHNSNVEKPVDPTREGADFEYWYIEGDPDTPYDFDKPVKKETKLIAKWKVHKYKVSFDSDGGSDVPDQEVEHGSKAKKPVDPKKTDYKFIGWYTEDDTPYDWDTPVKKEIKLIAKWEEIVYKTVSFVTNNDQTLDDVKVEQGTPVKKPTGLTKTGYQIEGWYTDSEFTQKWNFNDNVDEDITLYAKWVEKKAENKPSPKPDDEDKGDKETEPTPDDNEDQEQTPDPTPEDKTDPTPEPKSEDKPDPKPTPEPKPIEITDDTPDIIPPKPTVTVPESEDTIDDDGETLDSEITPNNREHVTSAKSELYMGGLNDDVENMKGAMAKFVEVVKKLAIVISISALAILGILFLILLLIAWLKKVKVLNDYNTDEYQDEDFQVVYKTSVKSEGNKIAELFKSEDRVWTLTIPEDIINERKTDDFEIELKKHFCKKYNGEQIMVILDNEDEEQRISLGFVIDKEDNILAFTYNEKEENA
ncbi:MAG: leucine-rich repeat protein [Lachnospiraceae bacterium]|nr:leucine-rich repeat protein [Lachnospiraceae bacterium]